MSVVTEPERKKLADAFKRRGMREHVRALGRRLWTEHFIREWMRYLRVPPHDNDYLTLPRGAPCPRCGSMSPDRTATGTLICVNFPGGWAERCLGCQTVWLHEERF